MLRIARGLRKPEVSVPCLEFQFVDADGGFNVGCIAVLLDELVGRAVNVEVGGQRDIRVVLRDQMTQSEKTPAQTRNSLREENAPQGPHVQVHLPPDQMPRGPLAKARSMIAKIP